MTVDDNDRLWFVETGRQPNRLVGFDPRGEKFFGATDLGPAERNTVRHMVFDKRTRSIWFRSGRGTIGRAVVPKGVGVPIGCGLCGLVTRGTICDLTRRRGARGEHRLTVHHETTMPAATNDLILLSRARWSPRRGVLLLALRDFVRVISEISELYCQGGFRGDPALQANSLATLPARSDFLEIDPHISRKRLFMKTAFTRTGADDANLTRHASLNDPRSREPDLY